MEDNFWASIGSPKLLCRRYGAQLTFTPMLHGRLFAESVKYRISNFETDPYDSPLIAQLCGDDAATLAEAAKHLKGKVAAVDINLGCPQGIAKDGHYGSFLLDEPDLITGIVSRITKEVDIPVTCKIRKVEKQSLQSTLNLCYGLEASGCKAITFHGRHRTEKGSNTSEADWEAIRIVKSRSVVIANGGIETFEDIQKCLDYTGADAVMSSEAILEKPYLFSGQTYDHMDIVQEYLDLVKMYPNQPPCNIRSHVFKILFQHCKKHHDMRQQITKARTVEEYEQVLSNFRYVVSHHTSCYTQPENSWYRRHRSLKTAFGESSCALNNDDDLNEAFNSIFGV